MTDSTTIERPDFSCGETLLWSSPVWKVGKHEWRWIVYQTRHPMHGRDRFTCFEFRGPKAPYWRAEYAWNNDRHWPGYNFSDGTYAGLPKTLAKLACPYCSFTRGLCNMRSEGDRIPVT